MRVKLICKKCGHTFDKEVYKTFKDTERGQLHIVYAGEYAKCEKCGNLDLDIKYPEYNVEKSKGAYFMKIASMTNDQKKDFFAKRANKIAQTKTAKDEKAFYKNRIIKNGGTIS